MRNFRAALHLATVVFQMVFMVVFAATGLILLGLSIAAAFGALPWLSLPLQFGENPPIEAGWMVQTAVTALVLGLAVYLPANHRILRLETSHRRFEVNMTDVARAYEAIHSADRSGVFTMKSEFDAVRERMLFLRNHPDLGELETDLMEVAAQMGSISHELAEIYSDEKVDRARQFLKQRQEELAQFESRIGEATQITQEIVHWARQLDLEESVAKSKLQRLKEELRDVLPAVLPPSAHTTEVQRRLSEFNGLSDRPAANRSPAE